MEHISLKYSRLLVDSFQCQAAGIYLPPSPQQPARLLASAGSEQHLLPIEMNPGEEYKSETLSSFLTAPVPSLEGPPGAIILVSSGGDGFSELDKTILESAAARLAELWQFALRETLMVEFLQSVGRLSMVQEVGSLMEMIASIARRILKASFTVVAAQSNGNWLLRSSGRGQRILQSLNNSAACFLEDAIATPYSFRLLDLRTDQRSKCIQIDRPDLCNLLASPILINGHPSFLILAFGKNGAPAFTAEDVHLIELLSAHAAQNLGSCYVTEKLRSTLATTQLLV